MSRQRVFSVGDLIIDKNDKRKIGLVISITACPPGDLPCALLRVWWTRPYDDGYSDSMLISYQTWQLRGETHYTRFYKHVPIKKRRANK